MNRRSFFSFLGIAPIAVPAAIATCAAHDSISWGPTRTGYKSIRYEIDPYGWDGPDEEIRIILAKENSILAERVGAVMRDPRTR